MINCNVSWEIVFLYVRENVWRSVFTRKRDIATFYYSLDNKEWKKIGTDFKMRFDYTKLFMGSKFAIFNYATKSLGGYVDVDYFDYERANDRVTINK